MNLINEGTSQTTLGTITISSSDYFDIFDFASYNKNGNLTLDILIKMNYGLDIYQDAELIIGVLADFTNKTTTLATGGDFIVKIFNQAKAKDAVKYLDEPTYSYRIQQNKLQLKINFPILYTGNCDVVVKSNFIF